MKILCLFACLFALCYQTYGLKKQAVARINARGITGTITFTEVDENTTRIVANLQGLSGNHGWHIHELPIDQTVSPDLQCLSSWAGPHYDPLNARANLNYATDCSTSNPSSCEAGDLAGRLGPLPANGQLDAMDTTGNIDLDGFYSIVGRSVVIHQVGTNVNFECGSIISQQELDGAEVTILQSVLVSPVAGRMYFKQVDGLPGIQIWGKLYHVNDSEPSERHNWHIHRDRPGEDYRVGICGPSFAGPHYDPTNQPAGAANYSQRCTPKTPEGCEIGDLTGKLGAVNVAAIPAPYATDSFFFTDSRLNLTGFQGVVNRSVVVHIAEGGSNRLSCAPLVEAENLTLTAYPIGGQPLAIISQYSRYQNTIISLGSLPSLNVPDDLGSDNPDLTVVAAAIGPNEACLLDEDATAADSTYSPYTPRSGVSTPDGYDLGDLSGAYKDYITSNGYLSVSDLPVFGAETTVSGRTLRYTYGNRRTCVPLLPPTSGANVTTVRASFSGRDVAGNVFFVQDRYDNVETGSTFILVDIYYLDANRQRTSRHNWHVHSLPAVPEQECTGVIGGHYNPFSVSLGTMAADAMNPAVNSNYSKDCTGNYQLRCESGDMTGKHGQLEIATFSDKNRPTFSYVDNNLELGGAYSIAGRSLGLHLPSSEGGALFDCATITPFYTSDDLITVYTPESEYTTR
ncbi:hypothetical protein GBAR_LOCUS17832 [Geodia barretti]|nr:hypothetical protein GBAR_LOCUS17832 [Geodia barretti]